jgi:hypothetical protein
MAYGGLRLVIISFLVLTISHDECIPVTQPVRGFAAVMQEFTQSG